MEADNNPPKKLGEVLADVWGNPCRRCSVPGIPVFHVQGNRCRWDKVVGTDPPPPPPTPDIPLPEGEDPRPLKIINLRRRRHA